MSASFQQLPASDGQPLGWQTLGESDPRLGKKALIPALEFSSSTPRYVYAEWL